MKPFAAIVIVLCFAAAAVAQQTRVLSGVLVTQRFEVVPGATVEARTSNGKVSVVTDADGRFSLTLPVEPVSVTISGKSLETQTRLFAPEESWADVQVKVAYLVPPVSENVTIQDRALAPDVETKDDSVYRQTLFGRDDQLMFTLNAGINAGQHEGGGKSLEIRRFGFNLDHGGVNGGLKVLVDNVQQNQGTQGHGQGYLGALKSVSPELIDDVSIINGPFSAAYGDFSGLGVVQINQKRSLPQILTARIQGGNFGTFRSFLAFSPEIKHIESFVAYEFARTDGPFANPLRYRRDNVTANFTKTLRDGESAGLRFNFGSSGFFSSGQIPLDLVESGRLDRFGTLDADSGGRVRLGTLGAYYRREAKDGSTFKADAFVGRSLFDLFSNFTFFLNDPVYGDEIDQHDSRLQAGGSLQYLKPYKLAGAQSLATFGGSVHLSRINVGLAPSIARSPDRKFRPGNLNNPNVLLTKAQADVDNYSAYVQNGVDFRNGHLRVEAGLRIDYFRYKVDGFELSGVRTAIGGTLGAARLQPKLAIALSPLETTPITFYFNYGRGISSQDARGVVRNPDAPRVATTDFFQSGASWNGRRLSLVASAFLIDTSNQQVYIPDDGTIEFAGAARSYGLELRNSLRINKWLTLNGGMTRVLKAFFPGEFAPDGSRVVVDSAPHTVANASLVFAELKGLTSSLAWRHISSYRLDGEDKSIRAAGNDVVDLSVTKRLRNWIDLSMSVDNLLDKRYFETQNYFESRTCPTCSPAARIHATPGYSRTLTLGVTFRLWAKTR